MQYIFHNFVIKELCYVLINVIPFIKDLICNLFFSIWVFSRNFHELQDSRGSGRPILTPPYQFHPLHNRLDINWQLIVAGSPLHIASGWKLFVPKQILLT